jgi:hypothetical protein
MDDGLRGVGQSAGGKQPESEGQGQEGL